MEKLKRFKKNIDKINSMNDLLEYFDQSMSEKMKVIKFGSIVTLKHVATGKYLSSSNKQVVRISLYYVLINYTDYTDIYIFI